MTTHFGGDLDKKLNMWLLITGKDDKIDIAVCDLSIIFLW